MLSNWELLIMLVKISSQYLMLVFFCFVQVKNILKYIKYIWKYKKGHIKKLHASNAIYKKNKNGHFLLKSNVI